MPGEASYSGLDKIAGYLEDIDRRLETLTAEIRGRVGGLTDERAEELLDRLDEMMDLLYLVDEHLCALPAGDEGEA